MTPPAMAGWNLILRFSLELTALAALAAAARELTSGSLRWVAVISAPIVAAAVWGTFNVPADPSRSGAAPVAIPGWTRLAIELLILGGGAVGVAIAGYPAVAVGLAVLIAGHYAASRSRLQWLLKQ